MSDAQVKKVKKCDPDRQRHCWSNTRLERLRERGSENGLAAYLSEIRNRLAPLIGHIAEG